MKMLHFAAAILFLWMTELQFNDPDPLYWVIIYGGTAAVAIGKGLGKFSNFWTSVLLGGAAAGMLIAAPSVVEYFLAGDFASIFGDMRSAAYVEPTREFFGLSFSLALLAGYLRH